MEKNLYLIILFLVSLIIIPTLSKGDNKPKFMGRIVLDGGQYLSQRDTLNSGVNFSDIRIGIKGTIDSNWYYKLDIGYSSNKVSAKDLFFGYRFKNHQFQIGQFFEPFSMDMLPSTVDMRFQQPSGIVSALGNGRKLGVSYTYNIPKVNFVMGVFSDNNANNLKRFSKAYSFHSRVIYRPLYKDDKLIHIAFSPSWKFTDKDLVLTSPSFMLIDEKPLSFMSFVDAKYQFRLGAEYYMHLGRFSFQTEYMMTKIYTNNYNYIAHGGFLELAYIPLGELFNYDSLWGCLGRPNGKSLELVARYNYQNLNDYTVDLLGGELHDISIGINYYINKNFAVKLNYNYLMPLDNVKNINSKPVSLIQLRVQFVL